MSIQGSAMMYVTRPTLSEGSPRGRQLLDELPGPLDKCRFHDDLIEAGGVRGPEAGGVVWFV